VYGDGKSATPPISTQNLDPEAGARASGAGCVHGSASARVSELGSVKCRGASALN